jgi:hypothetical protein
LWGWFGGFGFSSLMFGVFIFILIFEELKYKIMIIVQTTYDMI